MILRGKKAITGNSCLDYVSAERDVVRLVATGWQIVSKHKV